MQAAYFACIILKIVIMKNTLVTSETALSLEELGFYQRCEFLYNKIGQICKESDLSRDDPLYMCECPTLESICSWLKEEYKIIIKTSQNDSNAYYVIANATAEKSILYDSNREGISFKNSEEAVEKALQKILELLY